jgi:membrane-associated protein
MDSFLSFAFDIFNPETIIRYGGLTLLLIIIFAETGLFFGFFLPGDSLLFIAGLLSDSEYIDQPVGILILMLLVAAVSGTCVGYWFGLWTGDRLKDKKENLFYKRRYLDMTADFYRRYGLLAFVAGRFLPIVRTFVPILSGMIRIPFGQFFIFNVLGAASWIVTMVLLGHWLGNLFPNLINHVEYIIVGLVIVTAIPVIITYRRSRRNTQDPSAGQQP